MGDLVAVTYVEGADPAAPPPVPGRSPHVLRTELPVIEGLLRERGRDVLLFPVGRPLLDRVRDLALQSPAVVINLCEDLPGGSEGEMHFCSLLELLELPYTGSDPFALGLCRDKGKTTALLAHYGIPTPPFLTTRERSFTLGGLAFPLIVKPATEDGSLGIDDRSVCGDEETLRARVSELLAIFGEVLVEEYVGGRELNASVLGGERPRVLPLSEIDFSGLPGNVPAICGYDAKWKEESPSYRGTVPVCPARLEERQLANLETLTLAIFRILGLRDYCRIDWRLSPTRGPQFIEANPNPDISPDSGFIRSLRAAGMDYGGFIDLPLDAATGRRRALRGAAR